MDYKVFESSDNDVKKIVFTKEDAVYEAVLYKYGSYEERTVLCVSIQSGCAVGCTFCGTGKKLIRNLTDHEIIEQVTIALEQTGLKDVNKNCKKFQIMFMSMGEPFHNYVEMTGAIKGLYMKYREAQLLVSTIAPKNPGAMLDFLSLSKYVDTLGLQFSVHKSTDEARDELIPYKAKLSLAELRDYGIEWYVATGRRPYINYCIDGTNNTSEDFNNLRNLFPPNVFNVTLSVVCSADETMKDAGYNNLDEIRAFEANFASCGYNTRIFDPAGQDDIGGGCGQLWYVQDWMKKHNMKGVE